ncbi:MAG: c-type cytochrome [Lysobacterales bacterium]
MFRKTVHALTATAVAVAGLALINATASAATPVATASVKINVPSTYESMDTNHDMMVSKQEALAAMPNLDFNVADSNGDGELSRTEYQDLKEKVANGTWTNEPPKVEVVKKIEGYDDNPVDVVKKAPKGTLKDPYDVSNTTVAKEGHDLFLESGCSSCHGGTGGGGMGPPLTSGVWIYGDDHLDDTLFRLVTLGSEQLQASGYSRVHVLIPALMPPQGGFTVKKTGDLWKIITWIKSMNHPEK